MKNQTIEIKFAIGLDEVVEGDRFDEFADLKGLKGRRTRRHFIVTGTPEQFRALYNRCLERLGPGWDHPLWYAHSAKAGARKIFAALNPEANR